jgi:hypothetical protein
MTSATRKEQTERAAKRGAAELQFAQYRLADQEQRHSDMLDKTARLREQRLARDAAEVNVRAKPKSRDHSER